MDQTPFERAGDLHIGTVDFVSPDEVKITLDIEAPESIALNAGEPRPFPRVNSYLLIPVDEVFLVGQVEWLTVERSAFPKRRGVQDFGIVDLPYPLRRLKLNPLGTLRMRATKGSYAFRRGVVALPSVGAAVVVPTENQLRAIVESGQHRRVKIGVSPLAGDADVYLDPNRLFGRHLAVLGNTGSGKSCSVAGLIRWSLEQAKQECTEDLPNARFIVLDPNGEFSRAFSEDGPAKARIFKVNPDADKGEKALKVPLWFWNSAEWCSFTQASARTQRPLLRRALREVKAGRVGVGEPTEEERKLALRRYLSSKMITIQRDLRSGAIQTDETKFGFRLKAMIDDLRTQAEEFPAYGLDAIVQIITDACNAAYNSFEKNGKTIEYYRAFAENQVHQIIDAFKESLDSLGGIVYQEGPDEDMPIEFNGSDLADHLDILADQENVSQYLDFLIARIRTFLSDSRIKRIISELDNTTLDGWLEDYMGDSDRNDSCISVIDLSLVPTEIVHVITAVIARIIFEALQRHIKIKGVALPTVLVMEEAHTFIKRYRENVEDQDAATICCQIFERIAREGRKFGLGLVLSSQRPSELSPTVLSQCNTFLLHRISNDRDQDLVNRLVPDNLRGLLRELPSLPSQYALLLGWASELPVMVNMNDLPKLQQPHSDDPEFWEVWTGTDKDGKPVPREADWKNIVENWQGQIAQGEDAVDGEDQYCAET